MKKLLALLGATLPSLAHADWKSLDSHDQFNGAENHSITTHDGRSFLAIACSTLLNGDATVIVSTPWVLSGGHVLASIDGHQTNDSQLTTWEEAKSHKALMSMAAQDIISRIIDAKTFAIRLTDFPGETHTITFNVTGLRDALEQLKPHCRGL
jgi:hypothetical protein